MEPLIIRETHQTPEINLNGDAGTFSFSAKSYPENVMSFYKPVFDYIEIYKTTPSVKTTLEFNWVYFNTGTSKVIVRLILALQNCPGFEVKWYCQGEIDVMKEKGEEIRDMLEINLTIIEV